MKYLAVFMGLGLLVGVILFAQEPAINDNQHQRDDANEHIFTFKRFWVVNPDNDPFEQYIWTPRRVYLVGDKIPLYIEHVAKAEISTFVEPLSRRINRQPSIIRVKRGEYWVSKGMINECGDPYPPEKSRSDYIPPIEEIDLSKLHGRLVFPVEEPQGRFVKTFPNHVECKVGECYVIRLIDLTAGWKIKRTPEGRVLVQCVGKWNPDESRYDVVWFDIRGVYKVQYECSNIIEFEIR